MSAAGGEYDDGESRHCTREEMTYGLCHLGVNGPGASPSSVFHPKRCPSVLPVVALAESDVITCTAKAKFGSPPTGFLCSPPLTSPPSTQQSIKTDERFLLWCHAKVQNAVVVFVVVACRVGTASTGRGRTCAWVVLDRSAGSFICFRGISRS